MYHAICVMIFKFFLMHEEETKDDNKLEPSVEKKESPRTRRRNQSRSRSHSPKVKPSGQYY